MRQAWATGSGSGSARPTCLTEQAEVCEPCISLRYRIQLREHGGWYACEQQVYCWAQDGLIERIDLLCSGYQPIPAPAQAER